MNSVETTGKTVDEAIAEALIKLQAPSDKVTIEVLDEGNKGLLGFFGKSAHIRATLKEDEASVEREILGEDIKNEAVKDEVSEEKADIPDQTTKEQEPALPDEAMSELDAIRSLSTKAGASEASEVKKQDPDTEKKPVETREPENSASEETSSETEATEKEENHFGDKPSIHDEGVDVEKTAALFLMDVLEAMGLETAINTSLSEDLILDIDIEDATGEKGMGIVIGKRGQTLDALQYLTTMVVNKTVQEHVRVKIDVENYRERRQKTLENLAFSLARKVKKTGRKVTLEPMNPYERRIIHFALQNDPGVETHSEGEEPYRKVVITPVKNNNQRKSRRS